MLDLWFRELSDIDFNIIYAQENGNGKNDVEDTGTQDEEVC